jgi:hypothetical protein
VSGLFLGERKFFNSIEAKDGLQGGREQMSEEDRQPSFGSQRNSGKLPAIDSELSIMLDCFNGQVL